MQAEPSLATPSPSTRGKLLNYTNAGQNSRLLHMYARSVLQYGSVKKVVNALRTEIGYRRRDVVMKSKPYILFLEPLYYCNLDCPLCDRQVFPLARKNDAGKLALDLFDRILDEIGDYLFQCQIFGQGEPLMNWKLTRSIIERAHARRIFTQIGTNCTLITPELADQLVTSGLDYIVCAIDGVSQEAYETYRVGGKVADALEGLRLVVEAKRRHNAKIGIEWQYLTHSRNEHEVPLARKLAAELGVLFRTAPLCGMEWDREAEETWLVPGAKRHELGTTLNDFPCYFLWRSLVLNSNGKVARCLIYQNASQYVNLRNSSVMDAYNHPSVQQARRMFREEPMPAGGELPSPCDGCGYFARHHGKAPWDRNSRLDEVATPPAAVRGRGEGQREAMIAEARAD